MQRLPSLMPRGTRPLGFSLFVVSLLLIAMPGIVTAMTGAWEAGTSGVSTTPPGGSLLPDGNDNWWGGFGDPSSSPGTNGTVYAVTSYHGRLIVGGSFSTAGGIYVSNIAQWDGASWVGLGNGLNSTVSALAVYGDRLIAAGDFTQSGSTTTSRVAQWDGVTWAPMGTGMDGTVQTLSIYNNMLVAGGSFLQAGGLQVNRIARWDGFMWSALGAGVNGTVYTATVFSGQLVIGGDFDQAGTVSASRVALWDGSDWYRMSTGLNGTVRALYPYGAQLVAGGDFSSRLAKWDGGNWSVFGGGADYTVDALGSYEGDLIVGGSFSDIGGVYCYGIARWTGTTWDPLGNNNYCTILAVLQSGTNLIAAGGFTNIGGQAAYYVARWDASDWSGLASRGLSGSCNALYATDGSAYLGGNFSSAGGIGASRIARWNGASFSTMGGGMNSLVASLASLGSDIYAGGTFTTAGGGTALSIARWSGSSWNAVGGGMNHNVRALTTWSNSLIVGGEFTVAGSTPANRVARWGGSTWSALGAGTNGPVYALTAYGNGIVAGGSFTQAGGIPAAYIAFWDGTAWTALPGIGGTVRALHVHNGALIAGGDFADGSGRQYIAQWNGAQWQPLGIGLNGPVLALTTYNGRLIAGGTFSQAGGLSASNIAAWDGTGWSVLGSGTNNTVRALSPYDSVLLVGGDFTTAGSKPSYSIAQWTASTAADLEVTDIQWSPSVPYPGLPVQIRALIRNAGSSMAGSSTARIWMDGTAQCDLPVGTIYGYQDSWTDWCQVAGVAEGPHQLEACADVLNEVNEAFEDNNCRQETMDVRVPDAYYIPDGLTFHAGDGQVTIPVNLRYSQEVKTMDFRLCYDRSVFAFQGFSFDSTRINSWYTYNYRDSNGCEYFDIQYRYYCPGLPPGDGPIINLLFSVNENAVGGPTSIRFEDWSSDLNRVTLCDGTRQTPALLGGTVDIVPLAPYEISSISDVGNDQGRKVRVRWNRSWNDQSGSSPSVTSYDIYRRIDGSRRHSPITPAGADGDSISALRYPPGDWDFVKNVPASGEETYSTLCETLCDSTLSQGMCWSMFFVRAHTDWAYEFFDTPPDSGYSVDNLAPEVPRNLHIVHHLLSWDENTEEDLAYYSVYGSDESEFDPERDRLIGRTTDPSYDLTGAQAAFVHVTATDLAGNEGDAAMMALPSGVPGEAAGLRWGMSLLDANPMRDGGRIQYEVPQATSVELIVYDAAGRAVSVLAEGVRSPGRYQARWDGRDASGKRLPSGVYFCRFRAQGHREVQKVLLTR